MASKRIEWIDLAKGFCILLVVQFHVSGYAGISFPGSMQIHTFRMPLYFILSGLFFKQYEGFVGFLKRKINKLLIPFLFFFIVTSLIPYWMLGHKFEWPIVNDVYPAFNEPIWFLLCLFEMNVLFYVIQLVAGTISQRLKTIMVLALTILCGIGGLALSVNQINLPLYFGSALSALPFFAFGWWLRNHTQFLAYEVNLYRDIPLLVGCGLVVWLLASQVNYGKNVYDVHGIWSIYFTGIAGTVMVLSLSRIIKRIPGVSFWGRYSIIILCTHYVVLQPLFVIFMKRLSGVALMCAVFVATMVTCHFLILFMKRYMPHVTAQKDVIRI